MRYSSCSRTIHNTPILNSLPDTWFTLRHFAIGFVSLTEPPLHGLFTNSECVSSIFLTWVWNIIPYTWLIVLFTGEIKSKPTQNSAVAYPHPIIKTPRASSASRCHTISSRRVARYAKCRRWCVSGWSRTNYPTAHMQCTLPMSYKDRCEADKWIAVRSIGKITHNCRPASIPTAQSIVIQEWSGSQVRIKKQLSSSWIFQNDFHTHDNGGEVRQCNPQLFSDPTIRCCAIYPLILRLNIETLNITHLCV